MKTLSRFFKAASLTGALLGSNLEAEAKDVQETGNTENITYGIRKAIHRDFPNFRIQAEAGIFFPQNTEANSQNVTNLTLNIDSKPSQNGYQFYLHGNANLIISSDTNPKLDEFDMYNILRFGVNIKDFEIFEDCFLKYLSLDFQAVYLDQTNFDSNAEHSFNLATGLRYNYKDYFGLSFNYTNLSGFQALVFNPQEIPENLNQDIFQSNLTINTTHFNETIPFVLKVEHLFQTPVIGEERINSWMFSLLFQTPKTDYDANITIHNPILGNSYSLRIINKQKDTLQPKQPIPEKCPTLQELRAIPQDLSQLLEFNDQNIQKLLSCQSLVEFTINLDQIQMLKKAVGTYQNYTVKLLESSHTQIPTGRDLYELIKQIPRLRDIYFKHKIDSLAKFLIASDQSLSQLQGIQSFQLSDLERRFMKNLSASAVHFFDPSKSAYLKGDKFKFGPLEDQEVDTNQIAILSQKLYQLSYRSTQNPENLTKVVEFLSHLPKEIDLEVPYEHLSFKKGINSSYNHIISECMRLFSPILEQKIPIFIGHHNSIRIQGYDKPIINGENLAEISSFGNLKLNRLDQFTSNIQISEDQSQIIINLTMQLDAVANPPTYQVIYNKTK